jgi:hypothetical protein
MPNILTRLTRPFRAASRAAVFFLKLFPMLPSKPVDRLTRTPVIEKVTYPTCNGSAEGDLYLPGTAGPHPGIIVCLGVVPFGVDHPQVPVLGNALARSGIAALLYWSPSMRDFRLDPIDIDNIALAYNWLVERPDIDAARSGLLGTCVGGSFALMGAGSPRLRHEPAFLSAYAPFSSMWTFARDIASSTRCDGTEREPWKVDQLTRKVFVQSLTADLEPSERELLRSVPIRDEPPASVEGKAVHAVLTAPSPEAAESALRDMPADLQERLRVMSPLTYVQNLHAPKIILLHDRGDQVIPVGESRRLYAALSAQPGVTYTEMGFQHLDPVKGKLPLPILIREFSKFLSAILPLFRQTVE